MDLTSGDVGLTLMAAKVITKWCRTNQLPDPQDQERNYAAIPVVLLPRLAQRILDPRTGKTLRLYARRYTCIGADAASTVWEEEE
jgi:hypothetical protein